MKSIYDDFDDSDANANTPGKNPPAGSANESAAPGEAPAAGTAAEESPAPRPADGSPAIPAGAGQGRMVGVVNLTLLIAVIGLQVLIISWQRGINRSLSRLQEEVNLEKQQRIELGSDLLKRIDGVMQQKSEPARASSAGQGDECRVYMAGSNVNVRAGQSAKSKKVGKLKRGTVVTEAGVEGMWVNISFDGKSGWVPAKYLSPVTSVKVKSSKASVLAEPSRGARTLNSFKKNARGTVLGYRDSYFKAAFDGVTGWVHRDQVAAQK